MTQSLEEPGLAKTGAAVKSLRSHARALVTDRDLDPLMERIVPPARPGSVEDALHQVSGEDTLVIFGEPSAHTALLHIEESHPLVPLHAERPNALIPETYPTGM